MLLRHEGVACPLSGVVASGHVGLMQVPQHASAAELIWDLSELAAPCQPAPHHALSSSAGHVQLLLSGWQLVGMLQWQCCLAGIECSAINTPGTPRGRTFKDPDHFRLQLYDAQ